MPLRLVKNGNNANINHLLSSNNDGSTRGELRIGDYITTGSMLIINTAGNIGIATTSPLTALHVKNTITIDGSGGDAYVQNISSTTNAGNLILKSGYGSSGNPPSIQIRGANGNSNPNEDNVIYFQTNGVTRMIINQFGNVGIATTVPDCRLHIKESSTNIGGDLSSLDKSAIILERSNNTDKWSIANNGSSVLSFFYNTLQRGWIDSSVNVQNIDFTGQHRCLSTFTFNPDFIGYIVSATGEYNNLSENNSVSINESLPIVKLSDTQNDKTVFGVISDVEANNNIRTYSSGAFVSVFPKNENDTRLYINSLGEGGIWVCNQNGSLINGDYISTSSISGIGMRQASPFLANYTVAKITCNLDFNYTSIESKFSIRYLQSDGSIITKDEYNTFISQGVTVYMAAFVGCTYHCG